MLHDGLVLPGLRQAQVLADELLLAVVVGFELRHLLAVFSFHLQ